MNAELEMRRARPLMGTFVEISIRGADEAALRRAADRAFAAIEVLQARLSAHDPASELSYLNRVGCARPVRVSRDLIRVLRTAATISLGSSGAFDVTAGAHGSSFRDIEFLSGSRIRYARPLRVDLGGIAKGYCVDRAVRELRRFGIVSGLVNAGGDLRAFGEHGFALHLRHPVDPKRFVAFGTIRNAALSTSASYVSDRARCAGRMLDGRSGTPLGRGISVSVRAPSAVVADALTKVVALTGARAEPLIARYGARAWVHGLPLHAHRDGATSGAGVRKLRVAP